MITQIEIERRRKISKTLTGFKRPSFSLEHREKIRQTRLGKKMSEENKIKLAERMKGNKYKIGTRHTEEWKAQARLRKPSLGKKMSEDIKKKISKSKVGKIGPWKGKARMNMRGENHPNWKGVTEELKLIRNQIESIDWRCQVFKRDNYTCKWCNKRHTKLNAHHIKKFKDYPDLRSILSNGITLCISCHNKTKGKEVKFEDFFINIICQK